MNPILNPQNLKFSIKYNQNFHLQQKKNPVGLHLNYSSHPDKLTDIRSNDGGFKFIERTNLSEKSRSKKKKKFNEKKNLNPKSQT